MEMIGSNVTGATGERQSTTTTETLDNHDNFIQSGTDREIHENCTLSEEPESEELSDPIDNGYAWCILTFCSVMHLIVPGALKSFGVLYTELLEYYEEGAGNTAWIPSISLLLYFGLGPLANFLGERYTFRRIVAIGSCLFLVGYTSSAFVQKMEWLYLTYGVFVGWLEDATGSWAMSFNFVGILSTVSVILCLLERKCNRCWSAQETRMIGRQDHLGETVSMNISTACVTEMNNNYNNNKQLIIDDMEQTIPHELEMY